MTTAHQVSAQTAFTHGIKKTDLADYGYELRENKYATFDLITVSAGLTGDPDPSIGQIDPGAAIPIRVQCPECGEYVYEVIIGESDDNTFFCCERIQEFDEIRYKQYKPYN